MYVFIFIEEGKEHGVRFHLFSRIK